MFLILATNSDQGLSPFCKNNHYLEEPLFFIQISFPIFSPQQIQTLEVRTVSLKILLHLSGHISVQNYLKSRKKKPKQNLVQAYSPIASWGCTSESQFQAFHSKNPSSASITKTEQMEIKILNFSLRAVIFHTLGLDAVFWVFLEGGWGDVFLVWGFLCVCFCSF